MMNMRLKQSTFMKIKSFHIISNHLISNLKYGWLEEMPSVFGKEKKQQELIDDLPNVFRAVMKRYNLAPGDFPELESFRFLIVFFLFFMGFMLCWFVFFFSIFSLWFWFFLIWVWKVVERDCDLIIFLLKTILSSHIFNRAKLTELTFSEFPRLDLKMMENIEQVLSSLFLFLVLFIYHFSSSLSHFFLFLFHNFIIITFLSHFKKHKK